MAQFSEMQNIESAHIILDCRVNGGQACSSTGGMKSWLTIGCTALLQSISELSSGCYPVNWQTCKVHCWPPQAFLEAYEIYKLFSW